MLMDQVTVMRTVGAGTALRPAPASVVSTARGSGFPTTPAPLLFRPAGQPRCHATDTTSQSKRRVNPGGPHEGRPDVPDHRHDTSSGMSRRNSDQLPLRLRRCAVCGHPNEEHRGTLGCVVPRCECDEFTDSDLHPSGQRSPR